MSRQARRSAAAVAILTFLALCVATYAAYRYVVGFPERGFPAQSSARDVDKKPHPRRRVSLVIAKGASARVVARDLARADLISNETIFRFYVSYRGLNQRIRAGTYHLKTPTTPKTILDALIRGVPATTVQVTIPEGRNMLEVAKILADAGIAPYASLVATMRNRTFLRRIAVNAPSIEGFLFPDTYRFPRDSAAQEVLSILCRRHHSVFLRLRQAHPKRTRWLRRVLGWGHHEIVTLASIIEKETGKAEERPMIAGVFFNRLTSDRFPSRLLQTDPTIVYGCRVSPIRSEACRRFSGRIRRIHLRDTQNPYNTYTHARLPPGPISNPGEASLAAVFQPQRSRSLYFVSKNDGSHYFSATRGEHERAVERYQRGRRSSPAR